MTKYIFTHVYLHNRVVLFFLKNTQNMKIVHVSVTLTAVRYISELDNRLFWKIKTPISFTNKYNFPLKCYFKSLNETLLTQWTHKINNCSQMNYLLANISLAFCFSDILDCTISTSSEHFCLSGASRPSTIAPCLKPWLLV